MALEQYLKTETQRYFPDAKNIHVIFGEETIRLLIDDMEYSFAAGSDDDWYTFQNFALSSVFTIPLMPEENDA